MYGEERRAVSGKSSVPARGFRPQVPSQPGMAGGVSTSMNLLWYAIVGLVAGALAKWLMPGDRGEPKGCLGTILLGVGGAMLVGFLMETLLGREGRGGLAASIVGATLGALAILWLLRKLGK